MLVKIQSLLILIAIAFAIAWVQLESLKETQTTPQTLNTVGEARAFITYNPGLSDFQESVISSFVQGLLDNGWQVQLNTTHKHTSRDLSDYDLVVISTNTYWWAPDFPTRKYLSGLDLLNKPTVLIVTASGQAERALKRTRYFVEQAGGDVKLELSLFTWKPNDESQTSKSNQDVAKEMAYFNALALKPETF